MLIRFTRRLTGLCSRNWKPWPAVGEVCDWPDEQAQALVGKGIAETVLETVSVTPPENTAKRTGKRKGATRG
jgi:hypothetical protein